MIDVRPVRAFHDNYIWLIVNTELNTLAIVDPGDATPVLHEIEKLEIKPVAILITHHHGDHTGGVTDILKQYDVPVYAPANEAVSGRTHALGEGDVIAISALDIKFEVIDVPGHTSGHIAYYGEKMLFIGDTLFMGGCGRLFEGTAAQMHRSLGKIASLPDDTQVYCAHEYTLANLRFAMAVEPDNSAIAERTRNCEALRKNNLPTVPGTIAIEKLTNPFLRSNEPGVINAAEKHAGHRLTQSVEVFAAIRGWKDTF